MTLIDLLVVARATRSGGYSIIGGGEAGTRRLLCAGMSFVRCPLVLPRCRLSDASKRAVGGYSRTDGPVTSGMTIYLPEERPRFCGTPATIGVKCP